MCGERFSSEFSAEEKSAAAAPAPFALRDRWTAGYKNAYGAQAIEQAHWAGREGFTGYASKAEALADIKRRYLNHWAETPVAGKWFPVAPEIESGDHDVQRALNANAIDADDLINFAAAILNNRTAEFERLRVKLASKTVFAPEPKRTKAEVAEAIVAFLTDDSGRHGNRGQFIDLDEDLDEDADDSVEFNDYDGDFSRLRDLVREYRVAV